MTVKRSPLGPVVRRPKHLHPREQLAISHEAQAALSMRNHELVCSNDQLRRKVEELIFELAARPPPSDFIELRTQLERMTRLVGRLRAQLRNRKRRHR